MVRRRLGLEAKVWILTGAVALLSVNAAKGREYDLVVVAGCLDGVLPRTAWPEGLFEGWRGRPGRSGGGSFR